MQVSKFDYFCSDSIPILLYSVKSLSPAEYKTSNLLDISFTMVSPNTKDSNRMTPTMPR